MWVVYGTMPQVSFEPEALRAEWPEHSEGLELFESKTLRVE